MMDELAAAAWWEDHKKLSKQLFHFFTASKYITLHVTAFAAAETPEEELREVMCSVC